MPSRLNEYPVGITRPTTGFEHPRFSILTIIRGSTDSDEDVPRTIRISSRMYLMKRQMLNPWSHVIEPEHTKDEHQARHVERHHQQHEAAEGVEPEGADGEGDGAERAERRQPHDRSRRRRTSRGHT